MALPELVHDGENGYLFTDGNSQEVARHVVAILSDKGKREQMSQRSLEIIKAHDIEKTIRDYEVLYAKDMGKQA